MAITVTDAWKRAVKRKGARLRYLAIIEDGTNTWKCLDASHDTLSPATYPVGLAGPPSSVGAEFNPLTRESDIDQTVVNFRDGYLRPIMVANNLRGQALTVKMGAAEIDESYFCYYGSGIIDQITGDGVSQVITVSCLDPFTILKNTEILGYWAGKHPLEILYLGDGTGVLELAGIPAALIDTASFAPSAYSTSISHLNMVKAGFFLEYEFTLNVRTKAMDIANHIAMLLNGTFLINSSGQFSFKRFDATATEVCTWTDVEIRTLKHVEHNNSIINDVAVMFWQDSPLLPNSSMGMLAWHDSNASSQAKYAYKGGGPRVFSKEIQTDWLNGWTGLGMTPTPDAAAVALTLRSDFTTWGCTGALRILDDPQPAWAALSAERPAYFLIRSASLDLQIEIIKATAATAGYQRGHAHQHNPQTGVLETIPGGNRCTSLNLSGITRGMFETDAVDWSAVGIPAATCVHDITIPVMLTQALLERFSNGVDIIEITTGMGEFDKMVGDLVLINDKDFVAYGANGLDGVSVKYEVIQKEAAPENDQITWRVATAGLAVHVPVGRGRQRGTSWGSGESDAAIPHVISGMVSSTTAGLAGAVSAGSVGTSSWNKHPTLAQSFTYTASKDTYVTYNYVSRTFGWNPLALGDPAPTLNSGEIWVAKVVTGAAAITSHTDLRPLKAMDGGKLVALSVTSSELGASAVTAGKIATGGVSAPTQFADSVVSSQAVASYGMSRSTSAWKQISRG